MQCSRAINPGAHFITTAMYDPGKPFSQDLSVIRGFPGGSMVKNLHANAEDMDLIPGSGRSPGEGNGNPLHILAWKIPWMEKSGRLQSMGIE